jgi:hypothetical protein
MKKLIFLVLLLLLFVGCGSSENANQTAIAETEAAKPTDTPVPSTDTPTPWQSLCEGIEGNCLVVMFEDENCKHVGPEFVPAGQFTVIFSNHTDRTSSMDFEKLDEGKTWDDMNHYMSPLPFHGDQPDWSTDWINIGGLSPGKNMSWQQELNSGTYISICWQVGTHDKWLGGGLVVED